MRLCNGDFGWRDTLASEQGRGCDSPSPRQMRTSCTSNLSVIPTKGKKGRPRDTCGTRGASSIVLPFFFFHVIFFIHFILYCFVDDYRQLSRIYTRNPLNSTMDGPFSLSVTDAKAGTGVL